MKISDLRQTIDEQTRERKDRLGIIRDALPSLPLVKHFATIVTGVRRCGKSTLLNQWLERSCGEASVSLHFDDLRLASFATTDFQLLDEILSERNVKVVVLDEIQNIPEWERYVVSALDRGRNVLVTGSNATMLSRELGSKLTGRHLNLELFPFSFSEFLRFTSQQASPESLNDYLRTGGFPAYVETRRQEVLTELFNDIIYRDIVVRYGIRDATPVRALATYLLGHVGSRLSPSRLKDAIRVSSAATVLDYFDHLEETYLTERVSQFADSPKARLSSQKKVYACDTGLVPAIQPRDDANCGHRLENLVYLFLRRRKDAVSYFIDDHDQTECDFLIEHRNNAFEAIQVVWELTRDNEDREIAGVMHALKRFGIREGTIVTASQTDLVNRDGFLIRVVPAYEFLTGGNNK